jgi:restriction endonuclease S subunit
MAVWSSTSNSEISKNFGRLDAEYFRPEFISIDRALSKIPNLALHQIAKRIDVGHVGSMVKHYRDDGILILQTQNVKEFFLDLNHTIRITPEFHSRLVKSKIRNGDILIARSGSFGSASIYLEDAIINSADIIIVDIDELKGIDPLFLVVFMNSRLGSTQLVRFASGGVQGHVNLTILEHFKVPLLEWGYQKEVSKLVETAYASLKASEVLFQRAHELLVSELELQALKFDKPVGYTTTYSALELSLRSDAQHYQPRFAELTSHLSKFPTRRVRDVRRLNRRGIQPVYVEDGTYAVVNSQHLGPKHIKYEGLQRTTEKLFNAAPEAHIQKDDLLIYTTGAYIGRTNVYLDDTPAFASNHVNILRLSPDIDHAYMAMVFQSVIGQFQTQKHARGSAQAELYPADIDKFVVPLLPSEKQQEIGDLVRESLAQQRESARLLEQAKARVEQLIEEAVAA